MKLLHLLSSGTEAKKWQHFLNERQAWIPSGINLVAHIPYPSLSWPFWWPIIIFHFQSCRDKTTKRPLVFSSVHVEGYALICRYFLQKTGKVMSLDCNHKLIIACLYYSNQWFAAVKHMPLHQGGMLNHRILKHAWKNHGRSFISPKRGLQSCWDVFKALLQSLKWITELLVPCLDAL